MLENSSRDCHARCITPSMLVHPLRQKEGQGLHWTQNRAEPTSELSADNSFVVGEMSGMMFAHVDRRTAVEMLMSDIYVLGCSQIVFKRDIEYFATAPLREPPARRREMTWDTGSMQLSVWRWLVDTGAQRTHSLTGVLQGPTSGTNEPHMPIMKCMVRHASALINRLSFDQHGRTPLENARGTSANREVAEVGERMLFQPITGKANVRWSMGRL